MDGFDKISMIVEIKKHILNALVDEETKYCYLPVTRSKKGKSESVYRTPTDKKICTDKVDTSFIPSGTRKCIRNQYVMRGSGNGTSDLKLKCVPRIPPKPKVGSSERVQRTYHKKKAKRA